MKSFVLFCCSLLLPFLLSAQFFVNGNAVSYGDTCFQLTTAQNNQVGSIWHPDKINLNESFNLVAQVKLGCKDIDGADGIVFGLQPLNTSVGDAGGGLGFGGVSPSLGVELDTYENFQFGDPIFDHIALVRNGDLNHNNTGGSLAGPVRAKSGQNNIEDCVFHDLIVNWDEPNHRFDVFFDCELRLTYTGDIVQDIFNGDPFVFWGFTSATGGLNNIQEVCINYSSFLDQLKDKIMCPGGQVLLDVRSGFNYEWSPSIGLSNPAIYNPIASPDTTTNYVVEIYDDCGGSFFDDILITVAGDSTLLDLGQDSILCEGDQLSLDATIVASADYQWSTNETTPIIVINEEGEYRVTVTRNDIICVVEDKIFIEGKPRPRVDLKPDTSLCFDQTIWLDATFPGASYLWQDGSTLDSFFVNNEGTYQVTLTHPCGLVSDQINIFYENCQDLYLPNVFSPNLDGINDVFFPMDGGDVVLIHHLQIFNRWGSLVFEQSDFMPNVSSQGWNGKWNGELATQGLYLWQVDVSFRDGTREDRAGEVYLLK